MIASDTQTDTQTDRQNDADENNTSPKTKFLGEVKISLRILKIWFYRNNTNAEACL